MPSQEDFLNGLLNETPGEDSDTLTIGGGTDQAFGLEALEDMSEEQIARLLEEGNMGKPLSAAEPVKDVLDIVSGSDDSDLQEIQELLKKSDRNEAVDGVGDFQNEENPADKLLADIERAGEAEVAGNAADTKKEKALEKKRLKAEQKAARKAAREEKKEQRRAKKKGSGKNQVQTVQEGQENSAGVQEYDLLRDKELLDSIVSGAGRAERVRQEEVREENPAVDLMEVAAALGKERHVNVGQEVPYYEDEGGSDASMDSGVLALDMDEIDNYIPDITAEREEKAKKKGMFSRFVNFLMEEEEEPENENVKISDENQEIIREMDSEEAKKAKKKVEKKSKKKEKKKADKKKEQKPKKAKAPKPKKEKKPREEDPYPGKKLSFKKVFPIVLLGASLGAVLLIFVNLSVDYGNKQSARTAFNQGDYETCYTSLYGRKRNDAEEQMYQKSECILHVRMWYQEYEFLKAEGSELEALDSLIQSVYEYPELYEYAFQWNAGAEVNAVYADILNVLYENYGVTEVQAREIGALESDIAYTRAVMALVSGSGYGIESSTAEGLQPSAEEDGFKGQSEAQPDELPEEAELDSVDFVDNQ